MTGPRAANTTVGRVRRGTLITVALVVLAAVAWTGVVVFFHGQAGTWDAAWLDVTVYREGAAGFLAGDDVYSASYGYSQDLPFTYPPFALVLFVPLALVAPQAAVVAVFLGNVALLSLCVRWCADYAFPTRTVNWPVVAVAAAACAVFIEPVRTTIGLGQVNLLLLALVLGLDARATRWAGVGAGLGAAVKVTPGLLVAAQLVRRDWAAFLRGAGVFLACTLVAAVVAWDETITYYGRLLWQSDRPGALAYVGNQSLRGMVARLELQPAGPIWLLLAAATIALGCVAVARHRADAWASLTAAAMTGLLVSPVSWNHHWVWLLPVAAVGLRARRSPALLAASALLLLATVTLAGPGTFLDVSWLAFVWPFAATNAYVILGLLWLAVLAVSRTVPAPARRTPPSRRSA